MITTFPAIGNEQESITFPTVGMILYKVHTMKPIGTMTEDEKFWYALEAELWADALAEWKYIKSLTDEFYLRYIQPDQRSEEAEVIHEPSINLI